MTLQSMLNIYYGMVSKNQVVLRVSIHLSNTHYCKLNLLINNLFSKLNNFHQLHLCIKCIKNGMAYKFFQFRFHNIHSNMGYHKFQLLNSRILEYRKPSNCQLTLQNKSNTLNYKKYIISEVLRFSSIRQDKIKYKYFNGNSIQSCKCHIRYYKDYCIQHKN